MTNYLRYSVRDNHLDGSIRILIEGEGILSILEEIVRIFQQLCFPLFGKGPSKRTEDALLRSRICPSCM